MALLPVLTEPDPRLRKVSKPVEEITPEIKTLIEDMVETMRHEDGVGLAAPQINVLKRIIVIDCPLYDPFHEDKSQIKDADYILLKMINPVITKKSPETFTHGEACLSVPGELVKIERPRFITVDYLDEEGAPQTIEAMGILSICIQHEIDHLNGRLIIDSLSAFKKQVALKRLKKRHDG